MAEQWKWIHKLSRFPAGRGRGLSWSFVELLVDKKDGENKKIRPPTITRRVEIGSPLLQVQGAREQLDAASINFCHLLLRWGLLLLLLEKRPEAHKTDDTAQQGTLFCLCRFCGIPVNIIANTSVIDARRWMIIGPLHLANCLRRISGVHALFIESSFRVDTFALK